MNEQFVVPTLNRWRANFVLQGVSVARADECWRFVVRDGVWISRYSPRQALEYYLSITRDGDRLDAPAEKTKPLIPWWKDLPSCPRHPDPPPPSPEEQAEIDEIRNRLLHKVAHLSLGQ